MREIYIDVHLEIIIPEESCKCRIAMVDQVFEVSYNLDLSIIVKGFRFFGRSCVFIIRLVIMWQRIISSVMFN